MPEGLTFVVGLLLGLVVGIAASVAFYYSERQRHAPVDNLSGSDDLDTPATILDALPQSHIVLDRDDAVVRASTRAHAYHLIKNEHISRPEISELVARVRASGEIVDGDIRLPRSSMEDAAERRLWIRVTPMSGNRVLILFEDNTAKRRLEETRRDFVANVSHELKTPVGAVGLLAETIATVADEPDHVRRFATQLATESRRLGSLVQEIIELSRLQEGDVLADSEVVSIDDLVSEAVDRMRIEAESRNIQLITGGQKGLKVYGDRSLLATAVRNLLDNAVRYSRAHGRVSVGVNSYDGQVSIAVVDQGEGIPPEARERIFERFYRGDKARSRETGGSGLGLSIVKHVVADHGGTIKLWSEKGQGSTFTIILPEATGPNAETGDQNPWSAEGSGVVENETPVPATTPTQN